jgi:hypothetical protein
MCIVRVHFFVALIDLAQHRPFCVLPICNDMMESALRFVDKPRFGLSPYDRVHQGTLVFRPDVVYTRGCNLSVGFVGRVANPGAEPFVFCGHVDDQMKDDEYNHAVFEARGVGKESIIEVAVFSGKSRNSELFERVCARLAAIPCAKGVLSKYSGTEQMFIDRFGEIGISIPDLFEHSYEYSSYRTQHGYMYRWWHPSPSYSSMLALEHNTVDQTHAPVCISDCVFFLISLLNPRTVARTDRSAKARYLPALWSVRCQEGRTVLSVVLAPGLATA